MTRKGRRRGVSLVAAGLVAGGAVVAARDTCPVGHFTSAAGQDRFLAAYDKAMQVLPAPEQTLDLRTQFGVVRVYRFTSSASTGRVPMVLLPGRASASPIWGDNLPTLLRQAPIYTVDLLGEPGMSIQSRPITSAADQAQWLHQVLAQLPEPQLDLLGVSIGGWTATNLAVHDPRKIRSVILLDPVFVFGPISIAAIIRSIPASVGWLPKSWRDNFNSWTANGAPVEDVPAAEMIEAGMQSYALQLPSPQQITEQQLSNLSLPVLAILAGKSRMHDSRAAAAVGERALRAGQVSVYPDASHAINGEYPEQIAEDIEQFRLRLTLNADV
jgi:pimeloyl-ACP methyl ester carboxylesterase